jgi:hypothetical protein
MKIVWFSPTLVNHVIAWQCPYYYLRVVGNRVLRIIFGPKGEEVEGGCRRLHNEELYDLYASSNVVRVIKLRRVRWAVHIARMGEIRNVHSILVGKPERKRSLGRRVILEWILEKYVDVDWKHWLRIGTTGGFLYICFLPFLIVLFYLAVSRGFYL